MEGAEIVGATELGNMHYKTLTHHVEDLPYAFHGGVLISSELAHWTLPHGGSTPSKVDLTKIIPRVTFE